MADSDNRKCKVTLPNLNLSVEVMLKGTEIMIQQGDQIIRVPGHGEDHQEFVDAFLMCNRAIGLASETIVKWRHIREQVAAAKSGPLVKKSEGGGNCDC